MEKQITIRKNQLPKPLPELSKNEIRRKRLIGKVLTYTLAYLTSEFLKRDFEWLLPVILSKSTDPLWPDEEASIEKRVKLNIYGKIVHPTSSMIVHKIVACSLLYPKIFTFSPNIRIERKDRAYTGIHAYEFTQLDFEVRNATSQMIRNLVEEILCGLIKSLKENLHEELTSLGRCESLKVPESPFEVYKRKELEEFYGKNWKTQVILKSENPVWIIDIPREFYDFENNRKEWDNYDLLLPKYGEVLSGGRREWKYNKIIKKMDRDYLRKKDYRVLLKLARKGRLKPSAGAGIGIERLVSWIVGASHIGETQLFPRIPGVIYEL